MKTRRTPGSRRAGFTLIEIMIALTILGMIAANVLMVTRSSSKAYESGAAQSALDLQLERTMERIALAVMAARTQSLNPPNPFPLWTDSLTFDQSKGYEAGSEVTSDLQTIELIAGPEQIVWKERPGSPDERKVVWTNWVRDLFKDEVGNGIDDDANGLVDEAGLAFTIEGNRVTIRLTLQREGPDHTVIKRTQETTVTCRN
ncbi:MAG TPA: prepilin-type N-terminal cleavage/methylation domain-containing protein [Planctomycetota bacterium]|nr:prepilin-type N-terminal cleavage/methylation domain-containing protein [Planctomycetota bacterium]